MLPYLHILVRVEDDGSLHALGAFTSKEKQRAFQLASSLSYSQVRLDFFNGPFNEDIDVIYAGHRRWSTDLFQLGGYFKTESEAWTWVTQEGYVSVLRIDDTYEADMSLQEGALDRYSKLRRRWRLPSYDELVELQGPDKTRANIKLRFYEDSLESLKPKTRRDIRALYIFAIFLIFLPLAAIYRIADSPNHGEHLRTVKWLPDSASDISYYLSKQTQVYEFKISAEGFTQWAQQRGMIVRPLRNEETISRYKAYLPAISAARKADTSERLQEWQSQISAKINQGLIAENARNELALYDETTQRAYYEYLIDF